MKPTERAQNYLRQFNIQRLKIVHAYGKMLSYHSKLVNNPELSSALTPEEKEELEQIADKANKLFNKMDRFTSKYW